MRHPALIPLFLALVTLLGCKQGPGDWSQLALHDIDGDIVELKVAQKQSTVFIFLSPECPLCQSYSVKINALMDRHASDSLQFMGVVGGTYYPKNEIMRYLRKYDLMTLPVLLDPEFKLVEALGARITPEVVYTARGGSTVYQGAIDDWAIDLGQKRLEVSRDYLHDAIKAHQARLPVDPNKTKAVGCFIE